MKDTEHISKTLQTIKSSTMALNNQKIIALISMIGNLHKQSKTSVDS